MAAALKWIGIVLAGLLGLVILAILALPVLPSAWVEDPIEELASDRLGRDVDIGGVRIPFAWPPSLTLHDVRLADAPWAGDEPMARLDRLRLAIAPGGLFGSGPVLERVEVADGRVTLRQDAQGRLNWSGLGTDQQASGGEGGPPVRALRARDLTIAVRTPNLARDLTLQDVTLRLPSEERFRADGTLTAAGVPLQLDLEGELPVSETATSGETAAEAGRSDAAATATAGEFAVAGTVAAEDVTLRLDLSGAMPRGEAQGGPRVRGSVVLEGRSLAALDPLLGGAPPDIPPYRFRTQLEWQRDALTLAPLDARLGELTAEGRLQLATGEPSRLRGSLRVTGAEPMLEDLLGPRIHPEFGTARLDLAAEADSLAALPWNLTLQADLSQTALNPAGATPPLRLRGLEVTAAGRERPIDLLVRGRFDGEPVSLDARLGAPAHFLTGSGAADYPVRLGLELAEASASFEGRLEQPPSLTTVQGRVRLRVPDPAELGSAFGLRGLPSEPVEASVTLDRDGATWQADDLQASLGGSSIRGHGAWDGSQRRFLVDLASRELRLDALQALGGGSGRTQPDAGGGPSLPQLPQDLAGRIALDVDRLRYGDAAAEDLSVRGSLEQGVLRLDRLRLGGPEGGTVAGELTLDTAEGAGRLTADLRAEELHLTPWLAALGDGTTGGEAPWRSLRVGSARLDVRLDGAEDGGFSDIGGRLEARDVQTTFVRPGFPDEGTLRVDTATAELAGERSSVQAQGTYLGRPLRVDGYLEQAHLLMEPSAAQPVMLDVRLGETFGRIEGRVKQPLEGFEVDFNLRGPDLARLEPVVGFPIETTPPYDLDMRLDVDDGLLRARQIRGTFGDSDLRGELAYDPRSGQPLIIADLRSQSLDLDDLAAFVGAVPGTGSGETATPELERAAQQRQDPYLLPTGALDLKALTQFDADIRYRAESVSVADLPMEGLTLDFVVAGGRGRLEPLAFGFEQGRVRLSGTFDAGATPPELDLEGSISDVGLDQLTSRWDIRGELGGELEIRSAGDSLHRLAANADGRLAIGLTRGFVPGGLIELMGLDAWELLALELRGEDSEVPIRCAVVGSEITSGVLGFGTMVFATSDSIIRGDGRLDLGTERLELTIDPEPKDTSLMAASAPLKIEGRLKDLGFGLETGELWARGLAAAGLALAAPPAALLALVEPGSAGSTACAQVLDKVGLTQMARKERSRGRGGDDGSAATSAAGAPDEDGAEVAAETGGAR